MVLATGAKMTPVPVMHVNRPFVFWIRDLHTDAVLFAGRIVNPKPDARLVQTGSPTKGAHVTAVGSGTGGAA